MGRVLIFSFIKSNSCSRRLRPPATRNPQPLNICFTLILCIFLVSSIACAFEDNIEKDLQQSLEQSRTIVVTIQNRLHLATRNAQPVSNASITPEITQLKTVADNIRVSHLLLEERFSLREEKARSLGSKALDRQRLMFEGYRFLGSEALDRNLVMTEGYREASTEYPGLVDSLMPDSGQQTPVKNKKIYIRR